jgi:DNA-directed RNA polymerase
LAACDEYYHCCIKRDRDYTALPVAVDATCSGLQILAGLCRDASTASLVNVLPGERPADAYRTVAEHAKQHIDEKWRDHVDRGVAKRLVMTIPYNAKFKSNRTYVGKALNDPPEKGGKGLDVPKDDVTKITHELRKAVFEIFTGPVDVMKWFEDEVGKAIKRGDAIIQWCTPSGFVVNQKIMKQHFETVSLQLLGRVRIKVAVEETDTPYLAGHKSATAPNVIHSLDASLLHLASLRFDAPLSVIHDSVLCRATDMSTLSSIVREVYMHLFAEHDYLKDFAAQIGAETEPPIIGDLKPESVIESTYFFC